jgi:ABC-type branched-subunit amino acid transport system ATPase component
MSDPILKVDNLSVRFDTFSAVDNVSFSIEAGTITGLIGPNGAGKSSLFNSLVGEVPVAAGQILFEGQAITGWQPDKIYAKGLARTFQIPQPFGQMTVLENLMLSAPGQLGESFWAPLVYPGRVASEERAIEDKAREILMFTTLDRVAQQAAGALSGGQQKLLELARVLMGDPSLILLDEPAAGVNPALVQVLIDKIKALNARGVTFLIVEHNMDLIMRHCDPVIALSGGRIIFQGDSSAALVDERLLDAYLGTVTDA